MSTFLVEQSFTDFDLYCESIREWDLEFIQLGRGNFQAEILQFGDQDLQIGQVQYNKLLLQNGSAPRGGYTFAIHHDQSAPFLWRYQNFEFDSVIVFPENRELHGVSHPGHHPFVVTIAESILQSSCAAQGLPEPSQFIEKGSVSLCDKNDLAQLRALLTTLCNYAKQHREKLSSTLLVDARKWYLTGLLLSCLAKSKAIRPQKRKPQSRKKVVEKAIALVESDLASPKSMYQLSMATKVDIRSLRNIFYEHFSLSPQRFFKSYRLNYLRKALQESDPSHTLVSDVANLHGFWHMGQLAKDYMRQFGELPSETLQRP